MTRDEFEKKWLMGVEPERSEFRADLDALLKDATRLGRGGDPDCKHLVIARRGGDYACDQCGEGFMSRNDAQVFAGRETLHLVRELADLHQKITQLEVTIAGQAGLIDCDEEVGDESNFTPCGVCLTCIRVEAIQLRNVLVKVRDDVTYALCGNGDCGKCGRCIAREALK